jgi:hypothetical protein
MAKIIQKIKISLCSLTRHAREHGGLYGIVGALISAFAYFFIKTA